MDLITFLAHQRDFFSRGFIKPLKALHKFGKRDWEEQCPYCGSTRTDIDEDDDSSAFCYRCGNIWHETQVQFRACKVCGIHHSGNICNECEYIRPSDGATVKNSPNYCEKCGTCYDQETDEILPDSCFIES